jgi:hypothetical protein
VSDNFSAPAFISHLRLDQLTKKNFSIFGMPVHAMLLNIYLEFSNNASSSSYTPPKYTMCIQAHIPPALGAIHNFIQIHDPGKINDFIYEDFNFNIDDRQAGRLALGPANVIERT